MCQLYRPLRAPWLWAGAVAFLTSAAFAQVKTNVAPGTPVTITVTPAVPTAPAVSITLGSRHGHVTPSRCGFTHTGGGNIDIQQPTSDTIVVTMSGVCVAGAHPFNDSKATMSFDLDQCFEIGFDNPKVKKAKMTVEARLIGLLRSHCKGGGSAGVANAVVVIGGEQMEGLTLGVAPHSVGGGENLSMNCHEGPVSAPIIAAGKYELKQTFCINACHPRSICPCKAASAEFAADPALDPLWISYWEPFHGATKKDFGFQVTIKVADDSDSAEAEKVPTPAAKAGSANLLPRHD